MVFRVFSKIINIKKNTKRKITNENQLDVNTVIHVSVSNSEI